MTKASILSPDPGPGLRISPGGMGFVYFDLGDVISVTMHEGKERDSVVCKAWFTLATEAETEAEATVSVSVQVRTDTTEAETETSLSYLVL